MSDLAMTCPRKVFFRVISLFDLSHIDFSGSTSSRETSQCSLKRHSILTSHVNDSQFCIPGPDLFPELLVWYPIAV